jgi:hypothetical protein
MVVAPQSRGEVTHRRGQPARGHFDGVTIDARFAVNGGPVPEDRASRVLVSAVDV